MLEADYLVIGSGLAGLYFALRAAEHGRVLIATKRAPAEANTNYAQGGVAGVLDPDDRVEAHVEDTLRVGDGLCNRDVVEICVREGPAHISALGRRARRAVRPRTPTGSSSSAARAATPRAAIVHAKDMHRRGDPARAARSASRSATTASSCCPTTWRSIC